MATMTLPGKNGSTEYLTQEEETANLLDAVERIGPIITAHMDEAEERRQLSLPVLEAMTDAGLFRMMAPRSLGGLEVAPLTYAQVVEAVSRYDSTAGWSLCNPGAFAHGCSRLSDKGAEEILGPGVSGIISAAINPPIKAEVEEGGYRLTGRAPFVSNCHEASWFCVTANVFDGGGPRLRDDGKPALIRVYIPIESCRIIDTWSVMGMRGTGSDDVEVADVFVPSHMVTQMVPDSKLGSHYQGALYRFPIVGIVAANVGPVMLGIARNAINEVSALAQGKTPLTSKTLLRDKSSTQAKLAQAEAAIRSARALLFQTLTEMWGLTTSGETVSLEQRADLLLASANAVARSVDAVELMYNVAGSTGFYTKSPLERYFRDIQVLKQHGSVSEARFESVGQVFLGLKPDFPALNW